jgi:2'-hydroxyisoflavone reductase
VSSISAYAGEALGYENVGNAASGVDVGSPLVPPPEDFEMGDELPYGATKALGEKIAMEAFPGRSTVVRPGFIVGPGDPTDRFTYWPARIARGGEILVPGDGTDPVQLIDVRDLTEWIVRLAETGTSGVFNGVGPESTLSMAGMVYGIRAVTTGPIEFTWVPIEFLSAHDVSPYSDMPIWIPNDPLSSVGHSASLAAGLTFRPLATTAADTLAWHRGRGKDIEFGIKPAREAEVLAAWHAANRGQ